MCIPRIGYTFGAFTQRVSGSHFGSGPSGTPRLTLAVLYLTAQTKIGTIRQSCPQTQLTTCLLQTQTLTWDLQQREPILHDAFATKGPSFRAQPPISLSRSSSQPAERTNRHRGALRFQGCSESMRPRPGADQKAVVASATAVGPRFLPRHRGLGMAVDRSCVPGQMPQGRAGGHCCKGHLICAGQIRARVCFEYKVLNVPTTERYAAAG